MIPVDFGTFDDPWQTPEGMTEAAVIHPTAALKRSRMGAWTVLGANTRLVDSDFGDYACTARDRDISNADVGKFCNIAAGVRINPSNHPLRRASQHHFTYRGRSHQLDAEDDPEIFAWRRARRVTIGREVGHGAILMPSNHCRRRCGPRRRRGNAGRARQYDCRRRSGARAAPALRQKAGSGALADCLVGLVQGKARDRAAGFPRSQRRRVRCQK